MFLLKLQERCREMLMVCKCDTFGLLDLTTLLTPSALWLLHTTTYNPTRIVKLLFCPTCRDNWKMVSGLSVTNIIQPLIPLSIEWIKTLHLTISGCIKIDWLSQSLINLCIAPSILTERFPHANEKLTRPCVDYVNPKE